MSENSMITCVKCGKKNASHYKFCLGCGTELVVSVAPKAPSHSKVRSRAEIKETPGLTILEDESSLRIKYTIPGWRMPLFFLLSGLAAVMLFGPPSIATEEPLFFNILMFFGLLFGAACVLASYVTFPRPWFLSLKRPKIAESQEPFRQDHRQTPSEILIESGFLFRRRLSVSTHGLKQVSTLEKTQGPSESAAFNHHAVWSALWDVIAQFEDGRSVVLLPMIGSLEVAQTIEFLLEDMLGLEDKPASNEPRA